MADPERPSPKIIWIGPADSTARELVEGRDCVFLEEAGGLSAKLAEIGADIVVVDLSQAEGEDIHTLLKIRQQVQDAGLIAVMDRQTANFDLAVRSGVTDFIVVPATTAEFEARLDLTMERISLARAYRYASGHVIASSITLNLPSDLELVGPVADMLTRDLPPRGQATEEQALHIRLTLSEVLTNAIEHGSFGITMDEKIAALEGGYYEELIAQRMADPKFRDRRVFVSMELAKDKARYIIRDEGEGFDAEKVLKMLSDPEPMLPSGRGLFLIGHFMDEFEYLDGGRKIIMVKKLAPLKFPVT